MFQCRDIDALMMDWLYGELADQDAQSFSTHVDDCHRCHDELAAYQRTRELVAGLPSEEPSPALSALLIREAASQSPRTETAEGGILAWLGKLFAPLQHPALAAVATLVLVAGVAGTLYLRDGDEHFAEPRAVPSAETAPAPPTAVAAVDETSELDSNVTTAIAENEKPGEKPGAKRDSAVDGDLLERAQSEAKNKEVAADLLTKSRKDTRSRKVAKAKPKLVDDFKTNAVSGADPLPSDKGAAPEPEPAFEGTQSASDRPYRAYRDRPDSWVDAQQLRITEAYNRNDCQTAARIANDILDRSPELYTKRTRNLEAVKRCNTYVQREKSRRAVARKKSGSTSSNKAATKAKQEAPPADLELTD